MNMPANIDNTAATPAKRRVSAKVREALRLRVEEGLTWAESAERAQMSEAGIHKARKQPHVQLMFEEIKAQFIQDVEQMRAPYKAQAFEVAKDLMRNAKSEATKMRAVEFLAGESKKGGVNVAVQVNNHAPKGYEYVRPGQQVVEIIGGSDTTSSDKSPSDSA